MDIIHAYCILSICYMKTKKITNLLLASKEADYIPLYKAMGCLSVRLFYLSHPKKQFSLARKIIL